MEQASRSLDGLPPELLTLILVQIASTRDLHSLIRASAHCYRIFVLLKKRVLSSLVHRVFPPDVLREAYYVVKVSGFETRGPQKQQVLQFMETLDDDSPCDDPETLIPLSASIQLLRLHHSLDYFVQDYARRSISALQKRALTSGLALIPDPEIPPILEGERVILSAIEEIRLQRAFCQFELYAYLFFTEAAADEGNIYTHKLAQLTALEQADVFFARLAPWRVEEIACVRDYLIGRLEDVFDHVEDDYVKSVIAERFKGVAAVRSCDDFCCWARGSKDTSILGADKSNDSDLEDDNEDEMEDYGGPDRFEFDDHFFSQDTKFKNHNAYMEYMLSLGLPFLRKLFEAEGEKRRLLAVSNGLLGAAFLTRALKVHRPTRSTPSTRPTDLWYESKLIFTEDSILKPNEAWLWSKKMELFSRWDFDQGRRWRDWGFVFWDSSRLGASKILSKKYICPLIYPVYIAWDANLLQYSPWEVERSESNIRSRKTEPSAEERLKLMRPLFKPEGLAPVEPAYESDTSSTPKT